MSEEKVSPVSSEELMEGLKQVIDPELFHNIVELGLVYKAEAVGANAEIDMTLTSPGCPYGPMMIHQVKEVGANFGFEATNVEVVWEPAWGPDKMSEEIRLELGFDI